MNQVDFDFSESSSDFIDFHPHPWQRLTSREAWESVKASGWATRTAKQCYQILYFFGPLTLLEIEHTAAKEDGRKPRGRSESNVVRRLYDLRDNGLVVCTETIRLCSINKKQAVTWDVTDRIAPPTPIKKIQTCPHCGKPLKPESFNNHENSKK